MNVLVLMANYLPGFKAGGPVRSVSNLVAALGDEINFHIIARDRDLGSDRRYEAISRQRWQSVGKAQVAYVPPSRRPSLRLVTYAREARPDVLYINSFFNPRCCAASLSLLRCGVLGKPAVIVAPHGEFSPGALAIRPWKKVPYLAAMKALGLTRRALWHATSERESHDIGKVMGPAAPIFLAPNLCDPSVFAPPPRPPKQPGYVQLAFLSRIVRNKNLAGALQALQNVAGQVQFDIWGPIEDQSYWQRCREEIRGLPANVIVKHRGVAAPDQVRQILAQYDGILFPTHTENFGYAIVESFAAGCPVVISDRTPWQGLAQRGLGWDLPLDDTNAFRRAINELVGMDEVAHRALRRRVASYGRELVRDPAAVQKSRALFEATLGIGEPSRSIALRRAG